MKVILLAALLLGSLAIAQPVETPFTLPREGWSFDRSKLTFYEWAKPDELKAKGKLDEVFGWTEYDFEVPSDGWYELWEKGCNPEWTRTIQLDGQTIFWHVVSYPDDIDKKFNGFKEANLWLSKGKHTLRFTRLTWPGNLPDYWELRAVGTDPAGSLRATSRENVVRTGEKTTIEIEGGTSVPTKYEIVIRDTESNQETPAGTVEFPATNQPVKRNLEVVFPKEGSFYLLAKIEGKQLRPADLKAGLFVAVNTSEATQPSTKLETTPVATIDCTQPPPKEGFWEKDGQTQVVEKPFGRYRESSGLGRGKDGYWGTDGFSYRIRLPEKDRLYRLRVTYPDDDRRSMGFWINDGSNPKSLAAAVANTGGVETGDQYQLTQKMQVHESFFYSQGTDDAVVAVINLVPNLKAAAAQISIDLVEGTLPAAPLGKTRGRDMGFYFEESGRWRKFFGGDNSQGILQDMKSLDRWGQWNRYLGANLMFPTINVYQANHYPSRLLDGYFSRPINDVRLAALMAEKYQGEFVPEFHLTGQEWFDKEIMGVWEERRKEGNREVSEVKFASPSVEDTIIRDRDGNYKYSYEPFMYNALNPVVQDKYIAIIGELADSLADCQSFAGISSRMMFTWQWQGWNALPNMSWGYDDWTIAYFEKETGLKVPGKAGDPKRFRERYNFLISEAHDRWVEWRCAKIFEYHQRILARIRQARPTARLVFNWFPLEERHALSTDMLEQMREVGMDWHRYQNERDIVIIPPGGTYGRRFSTPMADAAKVDSVYSPAIQEVGRFAGRAYGLYSDYYEVNRNLDWAELGGKPYPAFDANLPSGLNERAMYAQAMADCDTGFFSNGGSGWIFGTPSILQDFFREYRSLPSVPFERWEKANDPVAIWSHRDDQGVLWFYAVNRLPVTVKASIGIKAEKISTAADATNTPLENGRLSLTLEPFMMRAFQAEGDATLQDIKVEVPPAYVKSLEPLLSFAKWMRTELAEKRVAPELGERETAEALAAIDDALAAFQRGEYFKARGLLERTAAIQVYYLSGKFPPGLWQRSQNHGAPTLDKEPLKVSYPSVNSGQLEALDDLTYDAEGNLWLSSGEQLITLDSSGEKIRDLSLYAPYDTTVGDFRRATLAPPRWLDVTTLRVAPEGKLVVQQHSDAPLLYEAKHGRRLPFPNKTFLVPGLPTALLAVTPQNEAVISCPAEAQKGTYLYNLDGTLKRRLTEKPALAAATDINGRIYLAESDAIQIISNDGQHRETIPFPNASRIAISPDGKNLVGVTGKSDRLRSFQKADGQWQPDWETAMPARVAAVAFAKDGRLVVGFAEGDKDVLVRSYQADGPQLIASQDLVRKIPDALALDRGTRLKVYDGNIYYAARGKLMRLIPGTQDRVEIAYDPGFQKGSPVFDSFAFAPNGDLYLSSNWNGAKRGINMFLCRKTTTGWHKPEALNQGNPLWEGGNRVAYDFEVDAAGRLVLSLPNEKAKGQNLSFYRWTPGAEKELLLDLGEATPEGEYGLTRTANGGLIIAGGTTRKLVNLNNDGGTKWLTERIKSCPPGYVDLRYPVGVTVDSRGQVWTTDPSRHQVVKFDPSGKLLGTLGEFGKASDSEKLSLNSPSGLAAIKDASGREWIYVADGGNGRIVKFPIP